MGAMLVADGHANSIIRIMWEQQESWAPWHALSDSAYISAFQAISSAFRAVPGGHFVICWNPNAGSSTDSATYPGSANVDVIGYDLYDGFGLTADIPALIAFAKSEGKPFAFPEWGLNGSDDPSYITTMASYINNPADDFYYQMYFSSPGTIDSAITSFPNSAAAYTSAFG
jgi:beta-mannanase